MWIVYKGPFPEVCVPSVGDVVLRRGEPKDIADTEKSRALLLNPDFEEVAEPASEEVLPVKPEGESAADGDAGDEDEELI